MSEICDVFKELKRERQEKKAINLREATKGIDLSNVVIGHCEFKKCSEYHFQLIHTKKRWMIDIWPSTQKIRSSGRVKAPHVKVKRPFTVMDVIKAVEKLEANASEVCV